MSRTSSRPVIVVGSHTFASKAQLTEHIRAIVAWYEPGEFLCKGDFEFIAALLERHPERDTKIGAGLQAIQVYIPSKWANCRTKHKGLLIIRTDSTTSSFSFHECINPSSAKQKFCDACRGAVEEQILEFRATSFRLNGDAHGRLVCPYQKIPIGVQDCHIDHVIPFALLVDAFLQTTNVDVNQVTYRTIEYASKPRFTDAGLEKRWRDFHLRYGLLQVISSEVNLRKGGKIGDEVMG